MSGGSLLRLASGPLLFSVRASELTRPSACGLVSFRRRFVQVFSECALVADTIGLGNQGISADVARTMHVSQWR